MYDFYPFIDLAEFFVHSFDGCRMEAIGTFLWHQLQFPLPPFRFSTIILQGTEHHNLIVKRKNIVYNMFSLARASGQGHVTVFILYTI